jgi:hypothetical protein
MKSTRGVSPHRERHHRKDGICRTLLQRSKQGWVEDIDKLAAVGAGACHHYSDDPRKFAQVMAGIGEYGDAESRRVRR